VDKKIMMKTLLLLFYFFIIWQITSAQKENFDLINYTAPKGWKKEVAENNISYTIINKNLWCLINIVKSTNSLGSIDKDFENEWQELVVKSYKPADAPQLNEVQVANGWKIKAGGAKFVFNNSEAMVFLTTASGYDRCASIIATTNSQDYIKDIEALLASVDLLKPEIVSAQTATANNENTQHPAENSIIGTWCITASDQSDFRLKNGIMSTIFRQYTFKGNGSYTCYLKTFDSLMNSIFLGRESGTYKTSGNNLTINPQKNVLEEWSKKNNADQWGKLLKTQKIALEKVTYSFSKIYIPENNEWQLILKTANQTKRDGTFNNYEKNAWIYIITSPARPVIKLPGE
jgi:hypothetical protein